MRHDPPARKKPGLRAEPDEHVCEACGARFVPGRGTDPGLCRRCAPLPKDSSGGAGDSTLAGLFVLVATAGPALYLWQGGYVGWLGALVAAAIGFQLSGLLLLALWLARR
jgi:hypothetical protein